MARVSTKQFHFSKFGGYAGLQAVLEQDFVDIPDLQDGELTRPGTYHDVTISEMMNIGFGTIRVEFRVGESLLHVEEFARSSQVLELLRRAGGLGTKLPSLQLRAIPDKFSAGYLNGEYYLINSLGEVIHECKTALELQQEARSLGVLTHLRGVEICKIGEEVIN